MSYSVDFLNSGFSLLTPIAGAQPPGGSGFMSILPFVIMLLAFYFLIIAPQNKKRKEQQKMIDAIEKGGRIKTVGGLLGTITGVKDDCFVVKVSENVKVEVSKDAISSKLN